MFYNILVVAGLIIWFTSGCPKIEILLMRKDIYEISILYDDQRSSNITL